MFYLLRRTGTMEQKVTHSVHTQTYISGDWEGGDVYARM
jgi:hypothetical protein